MESAIIGGIGAGAIALAIILWLETRRAGRAALAEQAATYRANEAAALLGAEKQGREKAEADVVRLTAKLKEVEDREVDHADSDRLAELSGRVSPADDRSTPPRDRALPLGSDSSADAIDVLR